MAMGPKRIVAQVYTWQPWPKRIVARALVKDYFTVIKNSSHVMIYVLTGVDWSRKISRFSINTYSHGCSLHKWISVLAASLNLHNLVNPLPVSL